MSVSQPMDMPKIGLETGEKKTKSDFHPHEIVHPQSLFVEEGPESSNQPHLQARKVSGKDTGNAGEYKLNVGGELHLVAGLCVTFQPAHSNLGASTLKINKLDTKSIVNADGSDLPADALLGDRPVTVVYDGERFLLASFVAHADLQS